MLVEPRPGAQPAPVLPSSTLEFVTMSQRGAVVTYLKAFFLGEPPPKVSQERSNIKVALWEPGGRSLFTDFRLCGTYCEHGHCIWLGGFLHQISHLSFIWVALGGGVIFIGKPRPAPSASQCSKTKSSPNMAQRLTPDLGQRLPSGLEISSGQCSTEEGKALGWCPLDLGLIPNSALNSQVTLSKGLS